MNRIYGIKSGALKGSLSVYSAVLACELIVGKISAQIEFIIHPLGNSRGDSGDEKTQSNGTHDGTFFVSAKSYSSILLLSGLRGG